VIAKDIRRCLSDLSGKIPDDVPVLSKKPDLLPLEEDKIMCTSRKACRRLQFHQPADV
jgi:hypothetical protein